MKSREVRGAELRSAELEITALSSTEAKASYSGDCSRGGSGDDPRDLEGGSRRGGTFFCRQPPSL